MSSLPLEPGQPPAPTPAHEVRAALLAGIDLREDQAASDVIDQGIRAGVSFRGTNLWLLIFAIVTASVGLNVNSTAVIIGAMLISPLMGPIMGVGYGAAVADFALVRLAALNLAIATGVSLAASAAYFVLTPLAEAHSELLARTSPTIWDVLVALFGGLAGIVGATRRERSNVLPGVAIATALMPPLCTAGYGLATGNFSYFAGAFYLYFINSVFIAAATFFMVRLMALPEVRHVDAAAARRAHRWIAAGVIATALPSVVLAQRLVAKEVFEARASAFLSAAFPAGAPTFVVGQHVDAATRVVHISVVGAPLSLDQRRELEALMSAEGLTGATLRINQAEQQTIDVATLREDLVGELYQRILTELRDRDEEIARLESELGAVRAQAARYAGIDAEILAQHPDVGAVVVASDSRSGASTLIVGLGSRRKLDRQARERLGEWLRLRAGTERVWVFEDASLVDVAPVVATPGP